MVMKDSSKCSLVIALLALTASCERGEEENPHTAEGSPTTRIESKADSSGEMLEQAGNDKASLAESSEAAESHRSWVGKILRAEDRDLFAKWAEDLSRNPNEKRHREQQLYHLVRAEVLAWDISHRDLEPVKRGDEPKEIEFPFFGDQTLTVIAKKIHHYGEQSVNLQGHLANDPKSKVQLNLSNQSPTVLIEGPNRLYYYESFEDVVILREDEPDSHLSHAHPHPHPHSHSHSHGEQDRAKE